jgi:hypothetical protein
MKLQLKRAWVIGVAAALIVALAGFYLTRTGHVPAGQPPLVNMNNQALSGLRADFNRDAANFRIILLLSPT